MAASDPSLKDSPATPADAYAALRFRDFRSFVIGYFLVTIGTQMQTVAVGWYLYERTGSALALGGVGLAQMVPIFALTLPAGQVSDRLDRRRIMIASYALLALASLGMALLATVH